MYYLKRHNKYVTKVLILSLFIFVTSLYWIGSDSLVSIDAVLLNNMTEYKNPEFNYTVLHPDNWQLNNEKSDYVSFIYTDQKLTDDYDPAEDLNPMLNISVTKEAIFPQLKYVQGMTEKQLEDELELSGYEDVSIISRSPFMLGELTGSSITYSYNSNYGTVIEEKVLLSRGDLLYDIVFKAEDNEYKSEIHDDVRKIIDSIRIPAPLSPLTEKTALNILAAIQKGSVTSAQNNVTAAQNNVTAAQNNVTAAQNNVTAAQSTNLLCVASPVIVSVFPNLTNEVTKIGIKGMQDRFCQ